MTTTTTNEFKIAAIGKYETRPVVWGLGRTHDEALEDAAHYLDLSSYDAVRAELRTVEIDADRVQRIIDGDFDACDLWGAA